MIPKHCTCSRQKSSEDGFFKQGMQRCTIGAVALTCSVPLTPINGAIGAIGIAPILSDGALTGVDVRNFCHGSDSKV